MWIKIDFIVCGSFKYLLLFVSDFWLSPKCTLCFVDNNSLDHLLMNNCNHQFLNGIVLNFLCMSSKNSNRFPQLLELSFFSIPDHNLLFHFYLFRICSFWMFAERVQGYFFMLSLAHFILLNLILIIFLFFWNFHR